MYYGWFDDSPKKPVSYKIEEAIAAYVRRFNRRPNVVLVNEADLAEVSGVTVRKEHYIRRDNFWVGWEERERASVAGRNDKPARVAIEPEAPIGAVVAEPVAETGRKTRTRKPAKVAA